jgi:hypothetical protein
LNERTIDKMKLRLQVKKLSIRRRHPYGLSSIDTIYIKLENMCQKTVHQRFRDALRQLQFTIHNRRRNILKAPGLLLTPLQEIVMK